MEGQHARSVRAGAFRKQDEVVARGQAVLHDLALAADGLAVAADKDGAAKARDGADDGPPGHVVLGDEARTQRGACGRDVEPGGMVADEQDGPAADAPDRRARDAYVQADEPGDGCPIGAGEMHLGAAWQQ